MKSQAQTIQYLQKSSRNEYLLDSNDVLGVFVEGVLGKGRENPPVHFQVNGSDGPSMGYPVVVRENGEISLPLVGMIPVKGLTISQVESLIKKAYLQPAILTENNRIMVSLMRKRTVSVTVIRGDQSDSQFAPGQHPVRSGDTGYRSDFSQRVEKLQLPIGDNDLLNALSLTGGIPGVNARSEIKVLRGGQVVRGEDPLSPFPRTGSRPPISSYSSTPSSPIGHTQRLRSGNIVVVEARPAEFYYTGGLLGGGQFPIPRDRKIDILEAVLLAGGVPQNRNGTLPLPPPRPTELVVVRKQLGGSQVNFRFSLDDLYSNPSQRIAVKPNDYLILQYSPSQRVRSLSWTAPVF